MVLPGSAFDPLSLWSGRYQSYESLRGQKPYYLEVTVNWGALPVNDQELQNLKTTEIEQDLIIVGAVTDLTNTRIKMRRYTGDVQLSNSYVPVWAVAGSNAASRQPYYWAVPLLLPGHTQLVIDARQPETGPLDPDGRIVFECVWVNR